MSNTQTRSVPPAVPAPGTARAARTLAAACGLAGALALTPQAGAADKKPAAAVGIDPEVLDRSVKPCDDFYRFACGSWLKKTEIPADRPSWSRGFSEIHERNQTTLRTILEDAAAGKPDASLAAPLGKKVGDFYSACMAEDKIEQTAQKDLAALLAPIDQIKTLDDLAAEAARQHLGLSAPLFHFGSQQDFKDATLIIGSIDQGGLGLPDRDYYLKTDLKSDQLRKDYLEHVAKMLTLAGAPAADAKNQAQTIFAIEKKLATGSMDRVDRRDPKKIYNRLEVEGLVKAAPRFPWKKFFTGVGLPEVKALNVAVPGFFSNLDKVVAEEPIANLKVYLRWHAVHGLSGALSKAFVDETFAFYSKKLTGTDKVLPRWKRCVGAADHALGEAMAVPYVAKTFGADGKAQAQEIISGIEAAMAENLKALPWMDDATRTAALGKLGKIANKIGYPDKPRTYDALAISTESHVKNLVAANTFETKRDLAKIGKPLDRTEWLMTAPTVNAYYEPLLNEIAFPAGILQPPMFSRAAARAVNYGAIGMVMGHEVTHGFDDEGRQFDLSGNLRDWWSPSVGAEFERRAECIVKQYNGYTPVEDLHVNGKLTLGENIADLGGLKLAYKAYQMALAKAGEKGGQKPAGSEFTGDQLFFLGSAQAWCDKRRAEYSRLLITVDPHSPPEYRVNGPLSNLPEFAKAFQCKPTDKMVRKDLCAVW